MEEKRNRRQIDRIEMMIGDVLILMNGYGETMGIKDKVNIMWGYRLIFITIITTNFMAVIIWVAKMLITNNGE